MEQKTPFVQFQNVCKYYQVGDTRFAASDHISFTIEKGEFCVILGPSGAGKTTVLNMLGGMDTCDEGTILLDGECVSSFDSKRLTTYRRYDVGFVFQFYNLVQNLTARENVELASEICKDPLDADTVLAEVGLSDRKTTFLPSFPAGNSNVFPSPERLQKTRKSCSAMSRQVHLIIKQANRCLPFYSRHAENRDVPLSSSPTTAHLPPWLTA